ncbi:MAG TPA: glycosyltransferase family 4 protein [Stellaceae bacterium]|jgi:glycosyltransferase involved in cell wall biosynthesis|nr:glycosyltransferase family 4 protein [Stellaceae bacterium]
MRIALYAPLKPPDHETPSGDRRVARLLLDALRVAGHEPFLASHLRSFDPVGRPFRQKRLAAHARQAAERLIARWRTRPETAPGLWFTYHLYYKAPDWLGPAVSDALDIPYIVAEASFAAKRAGGPWDIGHRAIEAALRQADRVIGLNTADRDGVLPLLAHPERYIALPPFLDASAFRPHPNGPTPMGEEVITTPAQQFPSPASGAGSGCGAPRLITVAMMRPGDKLASYRILGAALEQLLDLPWSLEVIGDGPAADAVRAALAPFGERVVYAGALGESAVSGRLGAADLFVWPAINEAFGMALLEAQASGLPVVAGRSGGVGDVVADGATGLLTPPGDVDAFAAAVRALLTDPARRARYGEAAHDKVRRDHNLPVAAARLAEIIEALTKARAA